MYQNLINFLAICALVSLVSCASSSSSDKGNDQDLEASDVDGDQQGGSDLESDNSQLSNTQANLGNDQDAESESEAESPDVDLSKAEASANEFKNENGMAQINTTSTDQGNKLTSDNAQLKLNNSGAKSQVNNRALENQLMANAQGVALPANQPANNLSQSTKDSAISDGNSSPAQQIDPSLPSQSSELSNATDGKPLALEAASPKLTWVGFDYRPKEAQARVEIVAEGSPQFDLLQEVNAKNQPELIVRLYETALRNKMRRDIDSSEFKSPVGYIRMRQNLNMGYCDVVITLRDKVNPRVFAEKGNILLTFQIPDRYYGNSSIGLAPEENAEFLTDFRVSPIFQPGSRLPQKTIGPDRKTFDKLPEVNQPINPSPESATVGGESVPASGVNAALSPNGTENKPESSNGAGMGAQSNVGPNPVGAETNAVSNSQSKGNQFNNSQNAASAGKNGSLNANLLNPSNGKSSQAQGNSQSNKNLSSSEGEDDIGEEQAEIDNDSSQENDEDQDADSEEDDTDEESSNEASEEAGISTRLNGFFLVASDQITVRSKQSGLVLVRFQRAAAVAQDEFELSDAEAPVTQVPANNKMNQSKNNSSLTNTGVATGNGTSTSNQGTANGAFPAVQGNATRNSAMNKISNPGNATGNATSNNALNSNISGNSAGIPLDAEHVQVSFDETVGQSTVSEAENLQAGKIIRPVRMEFTGAKLGDVLGVLAAENGLNFIFTDAAVQSTPVNFRLKDVSWTDALGALLETYGLGYVQLPGRVVRIDRIENLKEQKASIAEIKKQALQVQSTRQMMVRLSYAKAVDLQKTIGGMLDLSLDSRMKVSADPRTNTLIVEAVPEILSKLKTMIERLDSPTPQVRISARIVEVDDDFQREFGVKWGTTANLDASKGLGSGNLPFPNSSISRFAVDLPSAATGGLQFNTRFGHISNAVNLDAALQLSEIKSVAKILQNTSVLVADQQKAVMRAGTVDVFLEKGVDGSVAAKEVEYELKLDVTPSVTADGSVQLTLEINADNEKKSAAATAAAAKQTKKVTTSLLRKSGETAVIGGVYSSTKIDQVQAVPFLSKIPLIGWLFKNNLTKINKKELLIFVTPTIVTSENSASGTQANYVGSPSVEDAGAIGAVAQNAEVDNPGEESNSEDLNAINQMQKSGNNNRSNNNQNVNSQNKAGENDLSENSEGSDNQSDLSDEVNNNTSGQNSQTGNGNNQQNSNLSGDEQGLNEEGF